MCERRYQVNEQWHNLRPDALAEYRAGERRIRFWLEWDRGTMNVRDLTTKCSAYAHYLVSREWARERSPLPLLVCVTPDIAQEQRLARMAQATLAQTRGLMLWTTTSERLDEHGPLAPIWIQRNLRHNPAVHLSRRKLFDAGSEENDNASVAR